MDEEQRGTQFSRRRFLQALGIMTGAAAVGLGTNSRSAEASTGERGHLTARIGLLLPESQPYASLRTGFRLGLDQAGASGVELVSEQVGHPGAALQKARTLVLQEQVDLMVGVATPHVAAQLRPLLEQSGTFFIVADAGANMPRASEQSPNIFYHSLGYWRANWAMGGWTARNLGRRALIATSFYESGYDSLHTFRLGFEATGGVVADTVVTHVPPQKVDWRQVMAAIEQARPDFVYALYSGQDAIEFVRAYADAGLAGKIPLAGSAFLVDETLLPLHGEAARGIYSCLGWAPGLQNAENLAFMGAYRAMTGQTPDAFALLGYETAQLTLDTLAAAGGSRLERLSRELGTVRRPSPRGRVRMDATAHASSGPLFVRAVRPGEAGLQNEVIASLNPVEEWDPSLAGLRSGQRSGWTNAYLSV